jgi:D-lactate dehydrogenase (cytochrome)
VLAAVNRHAGLSEAERPTLFCEFHGTEQAVADQLDRAGMIAGEHGGAGFRFATREEDRLRLWAARHNAYFALLAMQPGCRVVSTDACVPVSRLAECVELTAADAATTGLEIVLFGHVADGNFHTGVLVDPESAADRTAADGFTSRLALRTIEMGGTVSGEHGIGLNKRGYLVRQYGAAAVDLMRTIKQALDPNGILNPDKVLPPPSEALEHRA